MPLLLDISPGDSRSLSSDSMGKFSFPVGFRPGKFMWQGGVSPRYIFLNILNSDNGLDQVTFLVFQFLSG